MEQVIILVAVNILPLTLHCLGIYSLISVRYLILCTLSYSAVDLTKGAVSNIIQFYLHVTRFGVIGVLFILVLLAMTFDRVAFVYLNMKYDRDKATSAAKLVINVSLFISMIVALALSLSHETVDELLDTELLYFWTTADILVLTSLITCYTIINRIIKRRKKNLEKSSAVFYEKKMKQATIVPKLIILTFLCFWTGFDIVGFSYKITDTEIPHWVHIIVHGVLFVCFCTDAIFYICFCLPIRNMWKRRLGLGRKPTRSNFKPAKDKYTLNNSRFLHLSIESTISEKITCKEEVL